MRGGTNRINAPQWLAEAPEGIGDSPNRALTPKSEISSVEKIFLGYRFW